MLPEVVFTEGFGIIHIFDIGDSGEPNSLILSKVFKLGIVLQVVVLISSIDDVVDGTVVGVDTGVKVDSIIRFCLPKVLGVGETDRCSIQ